MPEYQRQLAEAIISKAKALSSKGTVTNFDRVVDLGDEKNIQDMTKARDEMRREGYLVFDEMNGHLAMTKKFIKKFW